MANPFIGEIRMFGGGFAPRGWADCNGQLLPITSETSALFSLLGTDYGGDGETTFAVPDFRGRVPLHQGQGPGLSDRPIGSRDGQERVTLSPAELPTHRHTVTASGAAADESIPAGATLAEANGADVYAEGPLDEALADAAVETVGDSHAHDNMAPFNTVRYIIAVQGTIPTES